MSNFISSISAAGLSEMPPVSKVMPLPTSTTGASPLARAVVAQHDEAQRLGRALRHRQERAHAELRRPPCGPSTSHLKPCALASFFACLGQQRRRAVVGRAGCPTRARTRCRPRPPRPRAKAALQRARVGHADARLLAARAPSRAWTWWRCRHSSLRPPRPRPRHAPRRRRRRRAADRHALGAAGACSAPTAACTAAPHALAEPSPAHASTTRGAAMPARAVERAAACRPWARRSPALRASATSARQRRPCRRLMHRRHEHDQRIAFSAAAPARSRGS